MSFLREILKKEIQWTWIGNEYMCKYLSYISIRICILPISYDILQRIKICLDYGIMWILLFYRCLELSVGIFLYFHLWHYLNGTTLNWYTVQPQLKKRPKKRIWFRKKITKEDTNMNNIKEKEVIIEYKRKSYDNLFCDI